jgi:hypothetical protein
MRMAVVVVVESVTSSTSLQGVPATLVSVGQRPDVVQQVLHVTQGLGIVCWKSSATSSRPEPSSSRYEFKL